MQLTFWTKRVAALNLPYSKIKELIDILENSYREAADRLREGQETFAIEAEIHWGVTCKVGLALLLTDLDMDSLHFGKGDVWMGMGDEYAELVEEDPPHLEVAGDFALDFAMYQHGDKDAVLAEGARRYGLSLEEARQLYDIAVKTPNLYIVREGDQS